MRAPPSKQTLLNFALKDTAIFILALSYVAPASVLCNLETLDQKYHLEAAAELQFKLPICLSTFSYCYFLE